MKGGRRSGGGLTKVMEGELATLLPQTRAASAADAPAAAGEKAPGWSGLPDLGWIRKYVPMIEILDSLGVERRGRAVHCPAHDDRTPSASIFRNRLVCHAQGCGWRGSVIDVAILMLTGERDFSDRRRRRAALAQAVSWLASRYEVPTLERGARSRWRPGRSMMGGYPLDTFVRSGLAAALPPKVLRLIVTLAAFADDRGAGTMTYNGLRRFGRLRSNDAAEAIRVCRAAGILEWRRGSGKRGQPSVFQLNLDPSHCAVSNLVEPTGGIAKTCSSTPAGVHILTKVYQKKKEPKERESVCETDFAPPRLLKSGNAQDQGQAEGEPKQPKAKQWRDPKWNNWILCWQR